MTVTIEYEAEERLEVPYEEIIRNVVEEALDYVECPYDAEVNVVLTDNEGIHQINLDMRGIDRPTDVLSFPMCDFETPGDFDGLEETPALPLESKTTVSYIALPQSWYLIKTSTLPHQKRLLV